MTGCSALGRPENSAFDDPAAAAADEGAAFCDRLCRRSACGCHLSYGLSSSARRQVSLGSAEQSPALATNGSCTLLSQESVLTKLTIIVPCFAVIACLRPCPHVQGFH